MKAIYSFYYEVGRMGELCGVFIADTNNVEELLRQKPSIYLGEVLGKHSEVVINVEEDHLETITEDQGFIQLLEKMFKLSSGNSTIHGINPFDYWESDKKHE